jgi:hypothetical protein
MAKYKSQVVNMDLATLQASGYTFEADYFMGPALPTDCALIGTQIDVSQVLAGPGLANAYATINLAPGSLAEDEIHADLMTSGAHESGGQRYRLQVFTPGCPMQFLTAGTFVATLFYDQYKL